jgi:hypothetical protein
MMTTNESKSVSRRTQRTKWVHIRFAPDEFEAIKIAAAQATMTVSGFMRSLSVEGAGIRPYLAESDRAVLGLLLQGMQNICANLGKLTRALNEAGRIDSNELDANLRDVRAIAFATSTELKRIVAR